jgi:hypothetical protein
VNGPGYFKQQVMSSSHNAVTGGAFSYPPALFLLICWAPLNVGNIFWGCWRHPYVVRNRADHGKTPKLLELCPWMRSSAELNMHTRITWSGFDTKTSTIIPSNVDWFSVCVYMCPIYTYMHLYSLNASLYVLCSLYFIDLFTFTEFLCAIATYQLHCVIQWYNCNTKYGKGIFIIPARGNHINPQFNWWGREAIFSVYGVQQTHSCARPW